MQNTETFPLSPNLAPEIAAVIAAAVHLTLGAAASVTSVTFQSDQAISMENTALIWSMEGRRQIYTSHKVR